MILGLVLFFRHADLIPWVAMVLTAVVASWQAWLRRSVRRLAAQHVWAEYLSGRLQSCVDCGYDLRGLTRDTCPECGASAIVPKRESESRYREV
jgi:hypothetical protein